MPAFAIVPLDIGSMPQTRSPTSWMDHLRPKHPSTPCIVEWLHPRCSGRTNSPHWILPVCLAQIVGLTAKDHYPGGHLRSSKLPGLFSGNIRWGMTPVNLSYAIGRAKSIWESLHSFTNLYSLFSSVRLILSTMRLLPGWYGEVRDLSTSSIVAICWKTWTSKSLPWSKCKFCIPSYCVAYSSTSLLATAGALWSPMAKALGQMVKY